MNRKTRFGSSILELVLPVVLLLICILFMWKIPFGQKIWQQFLRQPDTEKAPIEYKISNGDSQFEQIWMLSPVFNDFGTLQGSVHLDATGNHAFLLGSIEEEKVGRLTLTKLDLLTGDVQWVKFQPLWPSEGAATTLDISANHIYVGFDGTQKIGGETTFGAGKIVAYDVSNGDMIWSKTIPGARSIWTLFATDDTVSVDGSSSSNYYLLDAQTGDVVQTREKGPSLIWFIEDGVVYESQKSSTFVAKEQTTNEIIWRSEVGYGVSQPPILTENAIIARSGRTGFLGSVFVITNSTGELIWEYKDVLSNVAVSNSTAFFLTKEMQLVAVDIETGKTLGQVGFTSDLERDRTAGIHHFVAAGDNTILVYLGDSQQLFSLSFKESD